MFTVEKTTKSQKRNVKSSRKFYNLLCHFRLQLVKLLSITQTILEIKQLNFKNKAPILKSVNLISFSTAWVSGISPDVNVQAKM